MSWKDELIERSGLREKLDKNGIYFTGIDNSPSFQFHRDHSKGAFLRKLETQKFHQIYWETPSYTKALDDFLPKTLFDKTILDFGCGDGRFTQFLLRKGAEKIVCVDLDYSTLLSLKAFAEEQGISDKLLIIHSDFENLPNLKASFDVVLSVGVLYYLNEDYEKAVKTFHSFLNEEGVMITSDPDLEGFLFRALIFDSLDEFIKTFQTRSFKETKEETPFRFRLFDQKELFKIFTSSGFKRIQNRTISSFHNILRVLLLRGIIHESDLEKRESEIWEVIDYLDENGKLAKHLIWNLSK